MANEYFVNSADLTSVADAIREKGETTEQLVFPSDFVTAIQGIKGGVELNFSVVGGETVPEDPAENTIWVNTPDEITGWTFSAEEPESPEPGMVWFFAKTPGKIEFNALKDNGIQVYLYYAKQYSGGEWEIVPAKIYQYGEWSGVEERDWSNGALSELWTTANNGLTVKSEANGIRITRNGAYGTCESDIRINIVGFNTLFVEYSEMDTTDVKAAVQVGVTYAKYAESGSYLAYVNGQAGVASDTISLPLSSVKDYEELYVNLSITGAQRGGALIERIWLE